MKKFSGFEEMNCVPHIVDILNSNLTHIFMLIIGGTCCFLPLLLGIKSYLEESTLLTSLTSGGYFRDSSTASLALALPMFLDLLVDFYNQLRRNRKQKVEKQRLCLNGLEKFVLLGGINAVPFVSLLPKDTSNLALILACCHNFRITIVGGIIITSLCRYNRKFWSTSVTITFIVVLSLAEVMSVFVGNIMVKDKHDPLYRNMQYVAIVFTWSPIVLLMVCNIRWLAAVINSWLKSSDHVRVKDSHLYFTMVWVFATISGIIALLINAVLYRTFDKIDEKALLLNNLIFLCFELVVTVFLMRMYKSDSVQGLVSHPIFVLTLLFLSQKTSYLTFFHFICSVRPH